MHALPCLRRSDVIPTLNRSFRSLFCYSTLSSSRVEQIHVPCRSNGHITLSLFHPLVASGPAPSIILYLPPGPVLPTALPTIHVGAALSSVTSATVVQINYRLSQSHQYPTPIHDVLTGYDWVLDHLIPSRAIIRPGQSTRHAIKIAVCGELIGGSLAAMLALTECRLQGPYIAAAAINEPIVDWVFPESDDPEFESESAVDRLSSFVRRFEPSHNPKAKKPNRSFSTFANNAIIDADTLLRTRRELFKKPEDYFDTFASPLFNFRSSGVSVPPAQPTNMLDEFAELSLFERDDFHRQQMKLGSFSNRAIEQSLGDGNEIESTKKLRRSTKRWPNAGSGLRIPQLRISSAETSPLSDQAREFAKYIQKSVVSQELKTVAAEDDEESREAAYMLADRQIQLEMTDSIRLWSLGQTHDLRHIAHWFEQILA